ncbi:class I SAM-dependent DNA methyltransferase [Salimicrobium halophilum]|uniref:Ubiquinone/menaquinone biosynthesis C-methylase UbiE n=1 Tax=Salimicrobium halophilum TaxID=86666 RepID=A0A1G8PP91_9BACI|nr:class I SAM-dependent methyltransferase [Salimicrobium halophilum]SDI94146.1 Ubiquinone/menaquinone biosynthesis C-methylase UbiE [Salimicrobium halophilum]
MSYEHLAEVYDRLMKDAPYEEWETFFRKVLEREQTQTVNVLELGCGTGEITHRLAESGYRMTGVDLSPEMLSIAASKRNTSIQWIQQDITDLQGFSGYDAVISFCDVVNYITDSDGLASMFRHTSQALKGEGLFVFDVQSPSYALEHLAGETFAEVYDDLSYIWFCDRDGDLLTHDLTFFTEDGQRYQRFDEEHQQRIYSLEEISRLLVQNGFRIASVHSDFSLEEGTEGDRIFFVCQKV